MSKKTDEVQPIIVKKIKKAGHGHHGGAWKVAYADFVTAMMAFFLLLWLLNVTTKDQKDAISNYFDPSSPKISSATSGAGGVMGGLSMTKEGAMAEKAQELTQPQTTGMSSTTAPSDMKGQQPRDEDSQSQQMEQELRARENERFQETKQELEKEIQAAEDLKDLSRHLMVDITPEGLRIQIIDQDGDPMFPSGSAQMFEKTQKLLGKVGDLIKTLPNPVSVRGHTDAQAYSSGADYTNWELSADRANASRRILQAHGLTEKRLSNVMGKAETDPFLPKAPLDPRNRRISILLLRESLNDAIARGEFRKNDPKAPIKYLVPPRPQPAPQPEPPKTYQKTQGAVQFP